MNLKEKNEQEERLKYINIKQDKYGSYIVSSPVIGAKDKICGSLDEINALVHDYDVIVAEDSPISLPKQESAATGEPEVITKIKELIDDG